MNNGRFTYFYNHGTCEITEKRTGKSVFQADSTTNMRLNPAKSTMYVKKSSSEDSIIVDADRGVQDAPIIIQTNLHSNDTFVAMNQGVFL